MEFVYSEFALPRIEWHWICVACWEEMTPPPGHCEPAFLPGHQNPFSFKKEGVFAQYVAARRDEHSRALRENGEKLMSNPNPNPGIAMSDEKIGLRCFVEWIIFGSKILRTIYGS